MQLAVGGYLLFKKNSSKFFLDKYTSLNEICEINNSQGNLQLTCKALLLNIRIADNSTTCFDIEAISDNKISESTAICEEEDTISYTNEILSYKKFMPVEIVLNYTKEGLSKKYKFANASVTKLSDEYSQDLIIKDLETLMTTDATTISVKNSIDFCPKVNTLAAWVSEADKTQYEAYYNQNTSTNYDDTQVYDIETGKMNLFLTCLTKIGKDKNTNCKYRNFSYDTQLTSRPATPIWAKSLDEYDFAAISQLTYFYDNSNNIVPTYMPFSSTGGPSTEIKRQDVLDFIVKELATSQKNSEEEFCTTYLLLKEITNNTSVNFVNSMKDIISNNIEKTTFPLCMETIDRNLYDRNGIYLHYSFSIKNDVLKTLNTCLNLDMYFE